MTFLDIYDAYEKALIDAAPTIICVAVAIGLPQSTYGILMLVTVEELSTSQPGQNAID